jgi:hydroxyethylthiazole kinase-like uncharacterized protein yjeF
MTLLYTTADIRTIEQSAGTSGLMEKAGLAAATLARELLGNDGTSVLVVAGPGNNGGDALVAARHLKAWWFKVTVVFTGERHALPADAAAALEAWLAVDGTLEPTIPAGRFDLVIDGLFGIGLSKPLQERYADLVAQINAQPGPILAIDLPSGLCGDTGRVLGHAVRASHTLTCLGLKPGLFTLEGPDHAGAVMVTDLGVDTSHHVAAVGTLIDTPPSLPSVRPKNAHKGSFGSIGILGGDTGMVGAAMLAGRAALLAGAGRVYVGLLADHAPMVDMRQPELMVRSPKSLLDLAALSALVIGPGLGRSGHALSALQRALHLQVPLLLDADALHLLAENVELRAQLHQRTNSNVITPHPGEAAGMLDCSIAEVQADRIASALNIARIYNAITVLKGCGSIIATPDGRWYVNASGNPGMSSAGMGDVLCGLIASLIGQGLNAEQATLLGVYLHGAAADQLVAEGTGPIGLTASEVAREARSLLNEWVH